MSRHTSRQSWARAPIPFLVLGAGLLATLAACVYSIETAYDNDEIRFQGAVEQARKNISGTVDTHVALLRAGAGLFDAKPDLTLEEFRTFVAQLNLRDLYPGIQGMGFARRVPADRLAAVTAEMRAHGTTDFAVSPADPRPDYFPIVYLEPLDRRNRAAIGYDMYTEAARHEAMERAARGGVPAASGKVTLKQEIEPEKQAGFLLYVPVYRPGAPTASPQQRLAALSGFVYSPFRAGDFLHVALGAGAEQLDVKVYDSSKTSDSRLFDTTDRAAGPQQDPPHFRTTASVRIGGRTWLLDFSTQQGFEERSERRLVPWILLTGITVSLLLFGLTRSEVKARASAELAAADLRRSEDALKASEAELRRLIDAERQAHADAEAANRAKDDFLATLSHELRTPLNAILGWATMLEGGKLSPPQRARAIEVIARNARTQAELIEDLLDVSRIITGKLRIELRPMAFASPVHAALDAVRPGADAKGVVIEERIVTDGAVIGDSDRLQQVAWNLLSNAIKFTPPGGRVVVSLEQRDSRVVLSVQDSGIGIHPDFLPHVFERFRQRDSSTTRAYGGMGLGLAIVRHLVELHGGAARARSEGEGLGATFTVELPVLASPPSEGPRPIPWAAGTDESPQDLQGLRALIVDDDHDSREMAARMLEQCGVAVVTAASAFEAIQALERQDFDVLLADISMSGTDGYALMRTVRAHPLPRVRQIGAIAVTAHAREEDRQRATEAGFQFHIPKPVAFGSLCDVIRRLSASV